MEIEDIILIVLVFVNLYFIYKTRNMENFESLDIDATAAVNDHFSANFQSIRQLSNFTGIISGNNDPLPTEIPILQVYGKHFLVGGNLKVGGDVLFTNKNTAFFNIFPKYMIMPWNFIYPSNDPNVSIPLGWAPCDGEKYKLVDNVLTRVQRDDPGGVLTPDLRGRMLLGAGQGYNQDGIDGTKFLFTETSTVPTTTSRKLMRRIAGYYGGEQLHKLINHEMPKHNHNNATGQMRNGGTNDINIWQCCDNNKLMAQDWDNYDKIKQLAKEGGDEPHNNMPPYYALTYIMKI